MKEISSSLKTWRECNPKLEEKHNRTPILQIRSQKDIKYGASVRLYLNQSLRQHCGNTKIQACIQLSAG